MGTLEEEGIRRCICDISLLNFHLILSSVTFESVNLSMARKILDCNLKQYPNGVFFLFGAGRISLDRSQPRRAIEYYTQVMESQSQYPRLASYLHMGDQASAIGVVGDKRVVGVLEGDGEGVDVV